MNFTILFLSVQFSNVKFIYNVAQLIFRTEFF